MVSTVSSNLFVDVKRGGKMGVDAVDGTSDIREVAEDERFSVPGAVDE